MSADRPLRVRFARALLALLAACGVLDGCGSSNFFFPGTPVVTMGNPANSTDFAAYIIGVAGLTFTQANGNVVGALSTPLTVNLSNLTTLSELVEAPAVASGTYTSAQITLSYVSSSVWASINGQAVRVAPVDITGSTLTYVTININFDPANPLVVPHNGSVRLQITIDPAASNSISTGSPIIDTVQPFAVISPAPVDSTVMRARGLFVVSQPQQSNLIINVRPFYVLSSALGALYVATNDQTYFNIDGTVYTGAAGLNAMVNLQEAYPVAAIGTLENVSAITPTLNATQVYVGASVEGNLNDSVTGVISRRAGNIVNVRGATFLSPYGTVGFFDDLPVTLGPLTTVTKDGVSQSGLTSIDVSVGQQVAVYGIPFVDSSGAVVGLDASSGGVRLQATPIWGTLNTATATEASLNLLNIDDFATAGFNFTGTGVGGTAADPTHYRVSTGTFDAAALPAGTLLNARGFPTPFGTAPPEFTAARVTPGDATEQQLLVEWTNGGAAAPFVPPYTTDIVVDANNPNLGTIHAIRTGPQSLDLKTLPQNVTVTTAGAAGGALQLAVGSATLGIDVFNSYAPFGAKLTTILNGTNKVYRLVAYGHYDSATYTFVASRIDVAIHL